jgi:hypothetical protein
VLPTFIVIGAKKSGTTSLFHYLRDHDDVWLPEDKRFEFFSGENWHRGQKWYEAQFGNSGGCRARGEVSTSYTRYPTSGDVAARMHQVVPDVRLVYLIRDPVDRVVSHYREARAEGWEVRPIAEAVLANPAEYVAPSRYAMQLGRYLEHFDRDQILVITTDELRDQRAATVAKTLGFIGVDVPDEPAEPAALAQRFHEGGAVRRAPSFVRAVRRSRAYRRVRPLLPRQLRDRAWQLSSHDPKLEANEFVLDAATRDELLRRLRPDLVALREIVGADFHCWGHLDP